MQVVIALSASAPARIDLAGGWTDSPPFSAEEGGAVVAAAVTLRAECRLSLHEHASPGVLIRSRDLGHSVAADSVAALEYDGTCDLAKAAVKRACLPGRVELVTCAQAPPGSGLGSSAALGVALVGAVSAAAGEDPAPEVLAERARELELELGILCGKQDHYAAALGGFLLMRFRDPSVEVQRLSLPAGFLRELERWCVLVHAGRPRLSGSLHERVFGRYRRGEPEVAEALRALAGLPEDCAAALRGEDPAALAQVVAENWRQQRRLHPAICDPATAALHEAARSAGALAGKACGAGGGGCSVFIVEPSRRARCEEALRRAGGRLVPFGFDSEGLRLCR